MSIIALISLSGNLNLATQMCAEEMSRLKITGGAAPLFVGQRISDGEENTTVTMGVSFATREQAKTYIDGLSQELDLRADDVRSNGGEVLAAVRLPDLSVLPLLFP